MAALRLLVLLFAGFQSLVYLQADYVGTPNSTARTRAVLKHSVELKCVYEGADGDGRFLEWYRDNITISSEKAGHYVVKSTPKESILTIKIFVFDDEKVNNWYVKTSNPNFIEPPACRFGRIRLKPSPQRLETDRGDKEKLDTSHGSVRRDLGDYVRLGCVIEPKQELRNAIANQVRWQFGVNDDAFGELPEDILVNNSVLIIEQTKKIHRGYYKCTLNNVSFVVLLRVKDRLAALWPFIGIVSVVLVLVIVILIFEKRQKSAKKAAIHEDDEHDQATDPLVRTTTTKASDTDTKKRAVKA